MKEKKTGRRLFDGTYTKDGRPLCLGGKPMSWLGRDPDGAHHFRCPPGGCPLKNKVDWSRYCNSEHSEKPEGRLLRIMGIVPRFSKAWRKIYKKRTEIERWFSSAKRSRLFDSHQLLRVDKINLHVNMSMLSWLLTALARLKADDYRQMRHMYIPAAAGRAGGSCRSTVLHGMLSLSTARQAGGVEQAGSNHPERSLTPRKPSDSIPVGI